MSLAKIKKEITNVTRINTDTKMCDSNITEHLKFIITPPTDFKIKDKDLPLGVRSDIDRSVSDRLIKFMDPKFYNLGIYKGFELFLRRELISIYIESSLNKKDSDGIYEIELRDNVANNILDNKIRIIIYEYGVLLQCYININNERSSRREKRKDQEVIERLAMSNTTNIN